MQEQKSSVSTLPENLSFDHGSTSSEAGIDSQVPWNNMQTSAEARLPEFRIPSSESNTPYLHHIGHSEWSLGETSSGTAQSQADHSEIKTEHTWNVHSQAALDLEEFQLESSNILSSDNVDVNGQGNQTSKPDSIPQDLNMCSEFGDQVKDDCQVIENPNRHISLGSSPGSSSGAHGMASDGRRVTRVSCKRKSLELQVGQSSGAGSSNGFEHSERNQRHTVASPQNPAVDRLSTLAANNLLFSNGSEQANSRIRLGVGGSVSSNPLSSNARGTAESSGRNFRLLFSGSQQQDHVPGIPVSTEANVRNSDVSSSQHSSRSLLRNHFFDLNPTPPVENGSQHGQSVLSQIPSVRRNPHYRWSGASSSRTRNSSPAAISLGRERDPMFYEESTSRNIPRSISEHPMFVPPSEMGGSSQHPTNWNLADIIEYTSRASSASRVNSSSPSPSWSHRNYPHYPRRLSEIVRRSLSSAAGNESGGQCSTAIQSSSPGMSQETALPSSPSWSHRNSPQYPRRLSEIVRRSLLSAAGTESGGQSSSATQSSSPGMSQETALPSSPSWSHRNSPQYPRRLSEIIRRSLLSTAGTESGAQSSSSAIRSSSPDMSQETALPSGSRSHAPQLSNTMSALLERHLEGALGVPYSLRSLAAGNEGRSSSIMSEIRHVLDLMRRGEGLRIEDMMVLDHSVFFGMGDMQDHHREMRMEVDNMSYEELLALEERIGNVCTGLNEETITSRLKQRKYAERRAASLAETEPCSICREEYKDGEDLGTLECGHDFHRDCIKQWLVQKNLCPICKTTGLST